MKRRIMSGVMTLVLCLILLPGTALASAIMSVESIKNNPVFPGVWSYDRETDTLTIEAGGDVALFGEFGGTVINNGTLTNSISTDGPDSLIFTGDVTNNGTISGGIFDGTVTNNGRIIGGTFNGTLVNQGTVKEGIAYRAAAPVVSVTIGTATTEYSDIAKAFEAASGKTATVKLLQSVDLGTDCLNVNNGNSDITLEMEDGVTLTSKNTSETILVSAGSFTLASGTVQNTYTLGKGIDVINRGGATISGGTVASSYSKGVSVISWGSITVTGDAVITGKQCGIYVDGTFSTAEISGGSITGTGNNSSGVTVTASNKNTKISGGSIRSTGASGYGLNGFAALTGGSFSGSTAAVNYSGGVGGLLEEGYGYYDDSSDQLVIDTSVFALTGSVTVKRSQTAFTITFDANNGAVPSETAETDGDGRLASPPPVPTWSGYDFLGWYTADGEKITINTVFEANATVYARWREITPPAPPTYEQLRDTSSEASHIAVIIQCAESTCGQIQYLLRSDSYELGAVTWDEQENRWYCDVTVKAAPYITEYAKNKGAHVLAEGQLEARTVRFCYTAGDKVPWRTPDKYSGSSRKLEFAVVGNTAAPVASVTIGTATMEYSDIAKAFEVASGKTATITLLADEITVDATLSVNDKSSSITLELNGKTLKTSSNAVGEVQKGIIVVSEGELIVQDRSEASTGLIQANNGDGIKVTGGGSLTVKSGTVQATSYPLRSDARGATVTVEGGAIKGGMAGLYAWGGKIVVGGDTALISGSHGIYATFGSQVTVTGGFINGNKTNIYLYNSTASVSGGWFKYQVSEGDCEEGYAPTTTARTVDSSPLENTQWYTVEKLPTYTVTFQTRGGSAIAPQTVIQGKKAVKPENPTRTGYVFEGWYTDESCAEEYQYDFTAPVKEALTLYAKWTEVSYSIKVGTESVGTASASAASAVVGTEIMLTAQPADGYRLKEWQVTPNTVTITGNKFIMPAGEVTVKAVFTAIYTVSVSVSPTGGGTVTGGGTYDADGFVTVTASPANGYRFVRWTEDGRGVSTAASYTFQAAADRSLAAEFAYDSGSSSSGGTVRYDVKASSSIGGGVSSSHKSAPGGTTVTITVTPDRGYELDVLTATDAKGNALKLTDKGDGRYTFKMPASKVTVEAAFTPVRAGYADCPRDDTCPIWPFADVDTTAWYHDGVHYCVDNGLMRGYDDGTFRPNARLSRAMLAQILYNREGRPAVIGGRTFTDVPEDMWCADAVQWAAENGIVTGYADGAFRPNDDLKREQLAAMLYRYARLKGYDTTQGGMGIREFDDYSSISGYAMEAMDWAVNAGVVGGYGDNTLRPLNSATRAQTAQMLKNFLENGTR